MTRIFYYLFQPGVLLSGLVGTLAQISLAFGNAHNVAGIADWIGRMGVGGQLASGSLVAALTGLFYAISQQRSGQAAATMAGAIAGGMSGTLGVSLSQVLGIVALAPGAAPAINYAAIGSSLTSLFSGAESPIHFGLMQMFDEATVLQVFGVTAIGGGLGALLGRRFTGKPTHHAEA